jgi:hypothetical protein
MVSVQVITVAPLIPARVPVLLMIYPNVPSKRRQRPSCSFSFHGDTAFSETELLESVPDATFWSVGKFEHALRSSSSMPTSKPGIGTGMVCMRWSEWFMMTAAR